MGANLTEGESTHPQLSGKLCWTKIALLVMEIKLGMYSQMILKSFENRYPTLTVNISTTNRATTNGAIFFQQSFPESWGCVVSPSFGFLTLERELFYFHRF